MDLSDKITGLPNYIKRFFTDRELSHLASDVPAWFIIVYDNHALMEYLYTIISEEDDYEEYETSFT